jgi:predicted TIM-barrel fold metal-dependent hydrolase
MDTPSPIIDVDIHHTWADQAELLEYLPTHWRELVRPSVVDRSVYTSSMLAPSIGHSSLGLDGTDKRLDSFPPGGGEPGSNYEWMRQQLLDRLNVVHGVLGFDVGFQAGIANPYLATEVCKAANDWSIDRWLDGRDDRLHGAILVATERPAAAAAEIRRLANNPRMAEVLLVANMVDKPYGHPFYDPIFEAADECRLPVSIHLGGELYTTGSGRIAAGGAPESRLAIFTLFDQAGMHHLCSLFTHAVFERYPNLKVLIKEHGFSWAPWLMWRLDSQYSLLRRENPLVRRLPSELLREHVWLSLQPFDHTDDRNQMIELLESFGGMEDVLVFATDYPHWDADEPLRVADRLPKAWSDKILHDNAAKLYGFPTRAELSREVPAPVAG